MPVKTSPQLMRKTRKQVLLAWLAGSWRESQTYAPEVARHYLLAVKKIRDAKLTFK